MHEYSAIFSAGDFHSDMDPIRIERAKTCLNMHYLSLCHRGSNGRLLMIKVYKERPRFFFPMRFNKGKIITKMGCSCVGLTLTYLI